MSGTLMSRQQVIEHGIHALHEVGSDHICEVCIYNGGSCCSGCQHLLDGVGCQQRNTGCTAWLCGFLKYLLYEVDLLQEWYLFWDQVPGKGYREDFTPELFFVDRSLSVHNIRHLSEALAADLEELAHTHIAAGFIITLREKIDKHIDRLEACDNNPRKRAQIKRHIRILSTPFYRFHDALNELNITKPYK